MNITNKTAKPIPITTGVTLAAGETRYVKDWPALVDCSVVLQAFVKEKLISVEPALSSSEPVAYSRSSLDGLELTDEARGMFVPQEAIDEANEQAKRDQRSFLSLFSKK